MINIGIDGFTGSGKSELSKTLSKRLGLRYLDTGAIFRAMAVLVDLKKEKITESNIENLLEASCIEVKFINDEQLVYVDKKDYTPYLRSEKISNLASKISTFKCVRSKFMEIAREFASNNNCIMEGRDICTEVLPNADVKFFLTADENVRARRRQEELKKSGQEVSFEEVLKNLQERDYRDTHRKIAPLRKTDDSIVIDSTNMTFLQVVEFAIIKINEKLVV